MNPALAVAAPQTGLEFDAAVMAAVTSSGVFARGTTVVVEESNLLTGASLTMIVNPDGSLTWREESIEGGVYRLTCVRVDRCWELSRAQYGDRTWHRLPVGSVTFEQASAFWARFNEGEWPAATVFSMEAVPGGMSTFRAAVPDGNDEVVHDITVNGPSVRYGVSVTLQGESPVPAISLAMSAQTAPVVVSAPARQSVGRRAAGSRWLAVINS